MVLQLHGVYFGTVEKAKAVLAASGIDAVGQWQSLTYEAKSWIEAMLAFGVQGQVSLTASFCRTPFCFSSVFMRGHDAPCMQPSSLGIKSKRTIEHTPIHDKHIFPKLAFFPNLHSLPLQTYMLFYQYRLHCLELKVPLWKPLQNKGFWQ